MDKLVDFIKKNGGVIGVSHIRDDSWSIGVEFGQEAEDPPMAGGASYGMGKTFEEALQMVLDELGLS